MTEQVIPVDAVVAAKEAMREVTPPPGVSKADWLAEHGEFALIAGAIAAAAPYIKAAAWGEGVNAALIDEGYAVTEHAQIFKANPYRSA